jgi:hypothetical protein
VLRNDWESNPGLSLLSIMFHHFQATCYDYTTVAIYTEVEEFHTIGTRVIVEVGLTGRISNRENLKRLRRASGFEI